MTTFDRVFFCNSGAEANEGAIKLARKYGHSKDPKKFKIITARDSFHGRTMETLTATGQDHYHEGLNPLPEGFVYVPFGDTAAWKRPWMMRCAGYCWNRSRRRGRPCASCRLSGKGEGTV